MRHWQVGDYLGGLFLGLVPCSIFMLLLGHLWYALCLAGGAVACLIAIVITIVVVAIIYDDEIDGIDANR